MKITKIAAVYPINGLSVSTRLLNSKISQIIKSDHLIGALINGNANSSGRNCLDTLD